MQKYNKRRDTLKVLTVLIIVLLAIAILYPLLPASGQTVDNAPPALARSAGLVRMLETAGAQEVTCDVYDLTVSPTFISGRMKVVHSDSEALVIEIAANQLTFTYRDMNGDGALDYINVSGQVQSPRMPELLNKKDYEQAFKTQIERNRNTFQAAFIVAVENAIECAAGGRPNAAPSKGI